MAIKSLSLKIFLIAFLYFLSVLLGFTAPLLWEVSIQTLGFLLAGCLSILFFPSLFKSWLQINLKPPFIYAFSTLLALYFAVSPLAHLVSTLKIISYFSIGSVFSLAILHSSLFRYVLVGFSFVTLFLWSGACFSFFDPYKSLIVHRYVCRPDIFASASSISLFLAFSGISLFPYYRIIGYLIGFASIFFGGFAGSAIFIVFAFRSRRMMLFLVAASIIALFLFVSPGSFESLGSFSIRIKYLTDNIPYFFSPDVPFLIHGFGFTKDLSSFALYGFTRFTDLSAFIRVIFDLGLIGLFVLFRFLYASYGNWGWFGFLCLLVILLTFDTVHQLWFVPLFICSMSSFVGFLNKPASSPKMLHLSS